MKTYLDAGWRWRRVNNLVGRYEHVFIYYYMQYAQLLGLYDKTPGCYSSHGDRAIYALGYTLFQM